jgi:hypothetical protein
MVGLFYIYLPMSWQIPTQIEQDIIAGKAKYQTFQTGNGGQSILQVPPNSYVVIFGYDFSPAGGGLSYFDAFAYNTVGRLNPQDLRWFETQQISFYTGNDFYPFIHHVDIANNMVLREWNAATPDQNIAISYTRESQINNQPIARQVYITSTNDVTITVGLILTSTLVTQNAIPITSRTPQALTYGGSPQTINTQTNFGPGGNPVQFMQPSTKDYQDFSFGLLPSNADNQAFATPDATNGLLDPSLHLANLAGAFANAAAANYYLCMHYAIYSKTVPEQRP